MPHQAFAITQRIQPDRWAALYHGIGHVMAAAGDVMPRALPGTNARIRMRSVPAPLWRAQVLWGYCRAVGFDGSPLGKAIPDGTTAFFTTEAHIFL